MSDYEIEIQIEGELPPSLGQAPVRNRVLRAAATTLEQEGIAANVGLSILLTDDEAIRILNRDFRGQDKPTDVLSFPASSDFPGSARYLGDVAISLATAERQSSAGGHSLLDELTLLTAHGVLHLLGYDHLESSDQKAMWAAQDRVLASLDLSVRSPDYDADAGE